MSIEADRRPTAEEVHNGIRTGELEEVPNAHRRNSLGPEELTPGRRIIRLDSPAPSRSPDDTSSRSIGTPTSSRPQLRLRRSSRQRSRLNTNGSAIDDGESGDDNSGGVSRRNSGALIRSRVSSPIATDPPGPVGMQLPLLLPAAEDHQGLMQKVKAMVASPFSPQLLRVAILVVKLLSLLQPCVYRGIRPASVYPLMLMAILEFATFSPLHPASIAASSIHVAVLWYILRRDLLCSTPEWGYDIGSV